jgi:hypothetical protein
MLPGESENVPLIHGLYLQQRHLIFCLTETPADFSDNVEPPHMGYV